jgi:hypothetical protein
VEDNCGLGEAAETRRAIAGFQTAGSLTVGQDGTRCWVLLELWTSRGKTSPESPQNERDHNG